MYSSSATTGDFENYIAHDVVAYIDAHYRTIANRESRGLACHSMGGYGASRIGMKHSDVFGALYIMSPCCMSPMSGSGPGPADQMKERAIASEKKVAAAKSPGNLVAQSPGFQSAQYSTAAAWAPDPKNPPLYFNLPTKDGVPQPEIMAKYAANAPLAATSRQTNAAGEAPRVLPKEQARRVTEGQFKHPISWTWQSIVFFN